MRGDDCDEEDEEISAEEKLKQLQALAQKERDNKLNSPSVKATAPSSTCSQSHWQHIGSLLLFTAAGVPDSSKVRQTFLQEMHIFVFNQSSDYTSMMFIF